MVIYRPQRDKNKQLTSSTFFGEFASFLELLVSEPKSLLIVGDFNFHIYTTIKTKDVCMYVCHVYTGHFPIDELASYFRQS